MRAAPRSLHIGLLVVVAACSRGEPEGSPGDSTERQTAGVLAWAWLPGPRSASMPPFIRLVEHPGGRRSVRLERQITGGTTVHSMSGPEPATRVAILDLPPLAAGETVMLLGCRIRDPRTDDAPALDESEIAAIVRASTNGDAIVVLRAWRADPIGRSFTKVRAADVACIPEDLGGIE